ncbi:mitochondrial amidoxime-reducing component 1-like [Mercenaria mercenaria]|uniref:mitochondrial amidoxime-reducing component 1-like n=1 Tax=Mercenaria mercenaria TaxID=6596 RepID=UPI001E1D3C7B|nr:mitochondrial amidoxime-reducing component 1-like [Mercenaria mercenaria]
MELPERSSVFLALAAGATLKYAALRWVGGHRRKEFVGKVSKVFVYPLKSGRELPGCLKKVSLKKHGIYTDGVGDRHWLVTKNGDMWTMKQNARLTLIRTSIEDNAVKLDSDGMESLRLPLDPVIDPDSLVTVTVKLTPLPALDCGDKAAAWVCKVLQQDGLRLNYSAPSLAKRLSCKVHKDWPTQIRSFDEIAFQDFCHCMIMCESSMEDLNKRLEKPLNCIPFRPNVMVEGTKPFDEDSWREVYFGETTKVKYVDKCTRCLITTIDPETGLKDKEDQPLKELKKFRCMDPYGPKPCMGIHTCVETEGDIQVGDPVYVIRK